MLIRKSRYPFAVLAALVVVIIGGAFGLFFRDDFLFSDRGKTLPSSLSPVIQTGATEVSSLTFPITPGDWQLQHGDKISSAQFDRGLVTLSCDVSMRTVSIARRAEQSDAIDMTIRSSTQSRSFRGRKLGDQIIVTLAADDTLLDAIAFSRGRFEVAVPRHKSLYPGSRAEVSRIVEDCRVP